MSSFEQFQNASCDCELNAVFRAGPISCEKCERRTELRTGSFLFSPEWPSFDEELRQSEGPIRLDWLVPPFIAEYFERKYQRKVVYYAPVMKDRDSLFGVLPCLNLERDAEFWADHLDNESVTAIINCFQESFELPSSYDEVKNFSEGINMFYIRHPSEHVILDLTMDPVLSGNPRELLREILRTCIRDNERFSSMLLSGDIDPGRIRRMNPNLNPSLIRGALERGIDPDYSAHGVYSPIMAESFYETMDLNEDLGDIVRNVMDSNYAHLWLRFFVRGILEKRFPDALLSSDNEVIKMALEISPYFGKSSKGAHTD